MDWKRLVGVAFVVGMLCAVPTALAAEPAGSELAPSESALVEWFQGVTHPADCFCWGGDLRLRQVYYKNAIDMTDEADDTSHFFRTRARLWGQIIPSKLLDGMDWAEGMKLYVRMTAEPRYFMERPGSERPTWDEVVYDNLYLDWPRVGGLPISVRIGRQDILYGRGFVILDGTPLDGSRTIYSDGIKATLHLDDQATTIDAFYINNKANEKRLRPFNETGQWTSEFDTTLVGAYLINKSMEGHELNAYYIYKDQNSTTGSMCPEILHTVGGLAQGKLDSNYDYYVEAAGQWGACRRVTDPEPVEAFGVSAEVGRTWPDAGWKPRVFGAYEYLSGDDPDTRKVEGWDPVLARWPHWSELYVYSWAAELRPPGYYTNVQRFALGAQAKPGPNTSLAVDWSWLRANERTGGQDGHGRGQLVTAKLIHKFSEWVSGHVWVEYFHPSSEYYMPSSDAAVFARWQLEIKLP